MNGECRSSGVDYTSVRDNYIIKPEDVGDMRMTHTKIVFTVHRH